VPHHWRPKFLAGQEHPANQIEIKICLPVGKLNGLESALRSEQEEGRAVASFEAADRLARDAYVRYLSRFFRAQILVDGGNLAGAMDMFRRALDQRPAAASAGRALAALYFVTGNRGTAERLIAVSLDASVDDDPWPSFAFGTFRLWPERLERLLEPLR
jgi:tetratricopeptide (TPR) repeat protein